MAKNKTPKIDIAVLQPDELTALKALVQEFIGRVENLDSQIEGLKVDRRDLVDEYSHKLDVKTLNAALRIVKIRSKCDYRDTLDMFVETLSNEE